MKVSNGVCLCICISVFAKTQMHGAPFQARQFAFQFASLCIQNTPNSPGIEAFISSIWIWKPDGEDLVKSNSCNGHARGAKMFRTNLLVKTCALTMRFDVLNDKMLILSNLTEEATPLCRDVSSTRSVLGSLGYCETGLIIFESTAMNRRALQRW
jgi:hypothetical protein